jgi:hypothetical protein
MRPKMFDFDPANADLTGFASNVTGATFVITTNETTDGFAHQVSIRNDSATDHSGKTVTLVGTDADGRAQTEVVTGPGASATVESSKYFKTLTSATPSATIGADTFDIGWVDEFVSQTIPLNWRMQTPATIQVDVTGTINFDIEGTLQDFRGDTSAPFTFADQEDLAWFDDANFTSKSADLTDDLALPGYRAIRFVVNSYTDTAEAQMYLIQPDNS